VRAAQIRLNPPTLVRVAQVRLPDGAVENGEVRDARAVGDALVELWHLGKFKGRKVNLGIGNQRVVVREVTLPWMPEKELRSSLPFQVQEYVPIPIDEASLDYHVLEELDQEGRRMVRLLLVAASKSAILSLVEAVEFAKLVPVGIDVVPFAIVRSVGDVEGLGLEEDSGSEAVVDIGADVTSLVVPDSSGCCPWAARRSPPRSAERCRSAPMRPNSSSAGTRSGARTSGPRPRRSSALGWAHSSTRCARPSTSTRPRRRAPESPGSC
jgi:type IV pilus assembly protein PilM